MLALALVWLSPGTPEAPPGFHLVEEREIWLLREHAGDSYVVTLVNDQVKVETDSHYYARLDKEYKANPQKAMHKIFLGHGSGRWSPGDGVKVPDGWIHGWDVGEFGGGLYWFSPKGEKYEKIDDRNTGFVGATSKGVFAFQGLEHMMFRYSRFVKLERGKNGWTSRLVTDLHDCPRAYLNLGDRFLYVGTQYISTMELDGTQRLVYRTPGKFWANSMSQRKNGEIWMGSSQTILCLSPEPGGKYKPYWFMPAKKS